MGDNQDSLVLNQSGKCCLNQCFILCVQTCSCLVQQDDRCILQKRTSYRDSLPFTPGKGTTVFADIGVPLIGQFFCKLVAIGKASRCNNLLVGGVFATNPMYFILNSSTYILQRSYVCQYPYAFVCIPLGTALLLEKPA